MEYIIATKRDKDWQKCLNQWRHDYHIDILHVYTTKDVQGAECTIVLTRTPKKTS